jgi:hypothetical protein
MLTKKQLCLISIVNYRRRHGLPTVQRDLAEAMGIRRDSLNKLLARTQKALAARGEELRMPPRRREGAADVMTLADAL